MPPSTSSPTSPRLINLLLLRLLPLLFLALSLPLQNVSTQYVDGLRPLCAATASSPATMNCSNLAPTDGIIWGMNIDLDRHDTITDMLQRIQWDRAPGAYGMFIKLTDRIIGQTPLDVLKKEDLDDFLQQIRGTNAIFVVSCDPIEGYAAVTDEAINQFAAKMAEYNQYGIPVLIRPAHEMNGPWYAWGQQPTGYIAFHRKLFTAVRRVAPQTQFVFAPNLGVGYPWPGGGWNYSITASSPDYSILDTNKDGSVNELDDPYTPYWPGDDYVQWFGVSIYWKGNYPYTENLEVPPNLITRQLTTVLGGGLSTYQFAERRNLPIVIPEMAGSYGIGNPGVSRTLVKQGFWQQVFGNEAHAAFPLLKMALWFDYLKFEDRALRDFTLTNTTTFAEIGSLFKADFQSYPHVLYASNLTLSSNNNEQCGCFKYNAERKALEASAVGGGSNASSNSGNGGAGADAGKDGAATGGRATNGVVGGSGMGVSGLVGVVTAVVGAVGLGLVW